MAMFDPLRDVQDLASQAMNFYRNGPERMPMDLFHAGDRYVLTADLPGIDPSAVDIDIDGQVLTVRAERKLAEQSEDVKWIVRERSSHSFVRQLNLGQGIDPEAIGATYDNGVLTVTIPLSSQARPRRIQVRSAGDHVESTSTETSTETSTGALPPAASDAPEQIEPRD